nr:hypothetical protein CFP56_61769 [Quercus suber]
MSVFLDCTFGRLPQNILASTQQSDRPVIFSARKKYWQMSPKNLSPRSMMINPLNPKCFQALTLTFPEIISEDSSSRFQVLDGFPILYKRAKAKLLEAQANCQPELLIIRPSAQWYACEEEY